MKFSIRKQNGLIMRTFEVHQMLKGVILKWIKPEVHNYCKKKPCIDIQEVYDYIKNGSKQQEREIGRFSTILKETRINWLTGNQMNVSIET
jgi:hypothetical protein